MTSNVAALRARQVWDSRGRPTIEVEIELESGRVGRFIAPSGASTGSREALDRRDGGKRLGGFGVDGAIEDLRTIVAKKLIGQDARNQSVIDQILIEMDPSPTKSRLGGNAVVATSCAVAWAAANDEGLPLWMYLRKLTGAKASPQIPLPMIQIFGGGKHAESRVDIQDFLVLCTGASSFAEALEWTAEIYLSAASGMRKRGKLAGVADEGGLWPSFDSNEEGIELLTRAIEAAGLRPKEQVGIALDIAATSFAKNGTYHLALENTALDTGALVDRLDSWVRSYPIVSLEDPVAEDDIEGFVEMTRRVGQTVQVIGDDFLVTNADAIRNASLRGAGNSALLKVNQCGTLTELIAAGEAARRHGWNTIQSGRSGESEDVSLSHFAVGLDSTQIKVGSIARSERNAKWNEVLRIAETIPEAPLWNFQVPEIGVVELAS